MLSSANGRHRRPRQAPAAMVTVAATGAGLALPLLGAGAAHAADGSTWDKVAICESGGQWDAASHNGVYGGLGLTEDTWSRYGGLVYAPRPDLASRSQQIAVAEKILADLGPDAWPGCELGTGLLTDTGGQGTGGQGSGSGNGSGNGGGNADGGSGATATPAPTTPSDPGTPTTAPTDPAAPTTPATPAPPTAPADPGTPSAGTPTAPVTPPATTAPTTPATPPVTTPPTAPADPAAPTAPTTGGGRHARPYSPTDEALAAADRATRTETSAVTENTPDGNTTAGDGNSDTAADKAADTYKVGAGDSLSGIAASQDVAGGWQHLYDANHQLIGDNPNLIKPGQILDLG